jgi:thiol-disulfide isomerase/thioredoxin
MLTELIVSFAVVALFVVIYYVVRGIPPGSRVVIKKPVASEQITKDQAKFMFFYTTWCPHCKKAQQPWYSFKELLKNREYTYGDKHIIFEEVNCEAERAKAALYQINAYPTFKLETKDDLFEMEGAPNADTFRAFLKKSLGPEKVV